MTRVLRIAIALALASCVQTTPAPNNPNDPDPGPVHIDPGQPVGVTLPPDQQAERDALLTTIAANADLTPGQFAQMVALPFEELDYDPATATSLDLLQETSVALTPDELTALSDKGFVISGSKWFPTFVYGYQTIYSEHLPVYVSADSILFAVHRSYDQILKWVEVAELIPELTAMLDEMRTALAAGGASELGEQARADADVYLALARGLLAGEMALPVAGGDPAQIEEMFGMAEAADGWIQSELFGVLRNFDFSQFKPRGHYTDSVQLERYFRAMMWLGRIDFRMLETQPDHSQVFRRRQLESALALRELMGATTVGRWTEVDAAVAAFVGESDYMTLPELDSLLADLEVTAIGDLAAIDDATISQAIVSGSYGTQRISSHIMINGTGQGTMPLSSSFALFGQRYVVDSHVFSNVVYDRVQNGAVKRMMPDPLDAAFAALGNDHAGALLAPQLEQYHYAPDLLAMRVLVDAHPADYWDKNLYNLWLGGLRALSPTFADDGPTITRTEGWSRRMLNTQLASWAELRHDTILYVKQSYTGGAGCEYPDAYVEPVPEFFGQMVAFADRGHDLIDILDLDTSAGLGVTIDFYFQNLHGVASLLEGMAMHQRDGVPHSPEEIEFINRAVAIESGGCEPTGAVGWYADLFIDGFDSITWDPTIADVHTQPTDEVGNPVGRVLHVGTGGARLMVVTVDTCEGPAAYVGLASSYFEEITDDFQRLDDQDWSQQLSSGHPADVSWMSDLVVH